MGSSVTRKIIEAHLVEGQWAIGSEIAIRIDQTLTQDATGTMAYLQFEAIGIPRVKTELSVSYVDHNTLQSDFKNADDHNYLRTVAAKHGIVFSRPGNGICHQLHLERFARPGRTMIGSDSHTPTAGGIGALAMGAGGLDVACAMAGEPFRIKVPAVVGIRLTGALPAWVSAKDVILELLRRVDVKGGVGKVFEYFGPGVRSLSVPDRATITNMGTETGCTTSIFPSDGVTKAFLRAQGREEHWMKLEADRRAGFDEILEIDLDTLEPLAAMPHSPGAVKSVREIGRIPVQQVCIGSCTNSSLKDMKVAAAVLKGKTIAENLHLTINPGSRQVVEHLADSGDLRDLVAAGARILENACGPCIGMGAAPSSGAVSVRTFNRNFEGRSGTKDAAVYLVSPEVAAATALSGNLTDPRDLGAAPAIKLPKRFFVNDNMFLRPVDEAAAPGATIVRGPNIAPLPAFPPLPEVLYGPVLLKVADNITTDHIMPAGAKVLPLRSNIPEICEVRVRGRGRDLRPAREGGRRRIHRRRRQLRAGLEPRARGAGAEVPGRQGGHRAVVRADPPRELDQLRDCAADVQEPGRLRRDRAGRSPPGDHRQPAGPCDAPQRHRRHGGRAGARAVAARCADPQGRREAAVDQGADRGAGRGPRGVRRR